MYFTPNYKADITVFILSYNRPHFIEEAVKSLMEQTFQPENIVVLDNCSSDDNLREIEKLSEKRLSVITAPTNHSPIWNYERAIEMAGSIYRTRYFYVMHDDDRILPLFLEQMIGLLERNPTFSAASCRGYIIDASGKRTGYTTSPHQSRVLVFHSPSEVALYYSENNCIPFPFVVYRNGSIQRVKIPVELGILGDVAYMCMIAETGPVVKSQERLFEYRMHESQSSKSIDEVMIDNRNQFLLSIADGDDVRNKIQENICKARMSRFVALPLRHFWNHEFEFGMRLLVHNYKSEKIVTRHLLGACIILFRSITDFGQRSTGQTKSV